MKVCRVFISGFVQGVGYRRFVRHHAKKLNLKGWVKNLPDNRVEALFCGSKERIEEIIKICEKGPFLSEVGDVMVEWDNSSKENFKDFKIIY
ncbi:MAG: acylphosphatase [Candidatus Levybacteria bacterium]|nr:acylphosphatase [Candidatus Levybacteria bacterium]